MPQQPINNAFPNIQMPQRGQNIDPGFSVGQQLGGINGQQMNMQPYGMPQGMNGAPMAPMRHPLHTQQRMIAAARNGSPQGLMTMPPNVGPMRFA